MAGVDDSLDFEFDDPITSVPIVPKKRFIFQFVFFTISRVSPSIYYLRYQGLFLSSISLFLIFGYHLVFENRFHSLFFFLDLLRIRKKVIGLDDLLADFYQERSKCIESESRRAKKAPKKLSSDELDTKEASLSMLVDQCQIQV